MKNLDPNIILNNGQTSKEDYLSYSCKIIESALKKIDRIIADSEKSFLEIGNNLQTNYTLTKDITNSATISANILSGNKMYDNISRLNKVMDSSGNYLANSLHEIESGEKILSEVLEVLNIAVDNLGGFDRIVKHLRMLGISTKIESARLNIEDSGFTAIADNVEKLSAIIHDKSNDIKEKAFFLIKIILAAKSKIENLENLQNEQSNLIISNTRSSFDSLLSRYNNYTETSKLISTISENVSNSISEIVSSIQIHDITRQQLGQVKQTLSDVLKMIKYSYSVIQDLEKIKSSDFYQIIDNCEIQRGQLQSTKNEFVAAVNTINQNICRINESLSELSSNILQISNDNSGDVSFITEIETGLKKTSTELMKNFNINSELAASMKSVADTVGSLNSYVHEIDEIGTEVEMIALNARVKAAHTGSEGAALGVLAESIQRLSGDARVHTIQMSETLTKIMKVAETLRVNNSLELRNIKEEEIQNFGDEITKILLSLKDIDSNAISQIINIKGSILEVKKSFGDVIHEFQINDTFDNEISGIITNLTEFTTIFGKLTSFNVLNKNENPGDLMNKNSSSGANSIEEKLATVRGMIKKDIRPKFQTHKNSDELGENIELF